MNEFYARDTSKKIRAVKQAQAQKGQRVNGEYPYGYIIDPNDKNHLIPDSETAHVVKQIFAMYIKGERICTIQKWLEDNKILTCGALRYKRTGLSRYKKSMIAPYTWPDKTIYDMLERKEYLGHTITGKTYKVSYKSDKTRKNPEEKRYFFPNTHEALIDEETFEIAQKRNASRTRPTKSKEIDIFSGLLFCGDCGHKMGLQQGEKVPKRKHAYLCGAYRNRIRTGSTCTTHYIRKSVICELVLTDLQRVLSYVKENEQEFIKKATEYGEAESKKELKQKQKELDKNKSRLAEIDILFRKIYEDNALGKLSDHQFTIMTSGYDEERKTLAEKINILEHDINTTVERQSDVNLFLKIVKKYTDIQELTYEILHEFIDKILIYEWDRETDTRKIEIYYSFVGIIEKGCKKVENESFSFRKKGTYPPATVI